MAPFALLDPSPDGLDFDALSVVGDLNDSFASFDMDSVVATDISTSPELVPVKSISMLTIALALDFDREGDEERDGTGGGID